MGEVRITWLGHATVLLEGEKRVLLDPWIEGNPACERSLADFEGVDLVCVTHGHNDHLGDAIPLCKATGARLICSPEIAIYAEKKGLAYDKASYPLNIGGVYRNGGVVIHMVNALHTSDILGEEWRAEGTVIPGSGCCGYVVRLGDAPAVYFAGDTGVFGDMALIGELYAPQVALLPAGGKYTMGVVEAAHAAKLIAPRVLIPIHYDTFPDQAADTEDLARRVAAASPGTQVVVLRPGESFTARD